MGKQQKKFSNELLILGERLRDLYLYLLAYEEVVLNPEEYLQEDLRQRLVEAGILANGQELNIEKISRSTDILNVGKFQTVSFESLITGVSFNIFGYLGGATPYSLDYYVSGKDGTLTANILRENQLTKIKFYEEGLSAPIDKSQYGGFRLIDDKIVNEIYSIYDQPTEEYTAKLYKSPFFPQLIGGGNLDQEAFGVLYTSLARIKTAYDSILKDANSNRQSVRRDSSYDPKEPNDSLNTQNSLNQTWSSLASGASIIDYTGVDGLNLADYYTNLFSALRQMGFDRDVLTNQELENTAPSYYRQYVGYRDSIVKQLLDQLEQFVPAQSDRIKSNAAFAALRQKSEELVVEYEAPSLTPFDFQCFLMENISRLADARERGQYQTDYKNIVRVTSMGDPGNLMNTIQHGGDASVGEFLKICPDVYGLLTPYIKLSRVEYDGLGNVKRDPNTGKPVDVPLSIPNFLSQDDISNILSGDRNRAAGAGIKSFSWSLDSVQPAETDNNIKATLVMYFQSMTDFFNNARQAGESQPNFLDLIINSQALGKSNNKGNKDAANDEKPYDTSAKESLFNQRYDGKDFRIKVCAGWSVPPLKALEDLLRGDTLKAKRLVTAIANNQVSLLLQMTEHNIEFNQNGSIQLTVQYQAGLAGLLTGKTADIFDVSSKGILDDIRKEETNIDNLEYGNVTNSDQKAIEESLEEIERLKNIDRNVKYKKLLKKLFDPKESKIRNISVNPNELTLTPYKDLTPEQRQKRVKRRLEENTFELQSIQTVNREILDAISKDESVGGDATAESYDTAIAERFSSITDSTKVNIPFFYLGDLLDLVLEEIKENNQSADADGRPLNFTFFIADVEMIDPLQAFKVKNIEDLIRGGYDLRDIVFLNSVIKQVPADNPELNGIYRTMNIGDIPISIDAFQLWFKDYVVKKNLDRYYFLHFVKDVCDTLITDALKTKCFAQGFDFRQRFDAQPMHLSKRESGSLRFTPNSTVRSAKIAEARALVKCHTDADDHEMGLILYSTDSTPKNLVGRYGDDLKRGIYHHYLGASCGLVKNISFSRNDQPFLRVARLQRQGVLGAEQLRELYSANIDLVGNDLYRNGSYIYVNPTLVGADEEFLNYLGLHGYYMITSVSSEITPGSFNTSIKALHQGIKFEANKLLPSDVDVGSFFDEDFQPEDAPLAAYDVGPSVDEQIAAAANDVGIYNSIGEAYARGDIGLTDAIARLGGAAKVDIAKFIDENAPIAGTSESSLSLTE